MAIEEVCGAFWCVMLIIYLIGGIIVIPIASEEVHQYIVINNLA